MEYLRYLYTQFYSIIKGKESAIKAVAFLLSINIFLILELFISKGLYPNIISLVLSFLLALGLTYFLKSKHKKGLLKLVDRKQRKYLIIMILHLILIVGLLVTYYYSRYSILKQ